jgi:hypothetical protein
VSKGISLENIARMNREYLAASLQGLYFKNSVSFQVVEKTDYLYSKKALINLSAFFIKYTEILMLAIPREVIVFCYILLVNNLSEGQYT